MRYARGMYHLPPNNAIGPITDLNRNDDVRAAIVQLDLELQNRETDKAKQNAGQGPGIDSNDA